VDLRALEREAKAQRDLLESYLAKYREATARDSLDAAPADARIISRASVSNIPVFPKKLPIVLVAALATMVLSATIIVTGELLGGGARMPVAVSRPASAAVPSRSRFNFFSRKQKKGAKDSPTAKPVADDGGVVALSGLARTLSVLGDAARRITVIGVARNVGTTYTALGLARALAENSRVVLVDLALNAPNVAVMSTNPGAPGIAELVQGAASFAEVITRDRFSRTHLVGTGKAGADADAVLTSPRLAATLEALARSYDHVVIDAGEISDIAVNSFARLAPRAVLVATDPRHPDTIAARKRLVGAGFTDVTVYVSKPGEDTPAAA
jgi:Mrp family chromosome partitioning ATPase